MLNADEKTKRSIERIDAILNRAPIPLTDLKRELVALLEHLSSLSGQTDGNCKAVDFHFGLDDTWPQQELPDDFHDLLAHMSEALHDAGSAPGMARNFGCTPELLLERARKLNAHPSSESYE